MINACTFENKLRLRVKDTCSSGTPGTDIKKGTGLSNSIERLHKLYGAASTFSILPYTDKEYTGMEVTITIPLQYGLA
jgi:LytS/YehU family sensor histidine kinase